MSEGSMRAADTIVRAIQGGIRDGRLKDGDVLPAERDLMKTYEVSRTVIREAVRILSSKGLVEARPRHRPVVRTPGYDALVDASEDVVTLLLNNPGGVRNLFDMRIMIEASLVREAALNARAVDIRALDDALQANARAIPDSAAFYRTDVDFHAVFYRIPGNPVLPALHKAYTAWLAPQWSRMPRRPDRNRGNHEAHTRIFQAILMRDADAAEAALRTHLAQAWQQVSETFDDL